MNPVEQESQKTTPDVMIQSHSFPFLVAIQSCVASFDSFNTFDLLNFDTFDFRSIFS
jgi:hypothetical protein